MATILAFIQARVGSTRLPGKVLLPIHGRTVLEHVIRRVQASRFVSEVLIVTTISAADLAIVSLSASLKTRVFCGSEDDVLDRFYQAAKILRPDHVVRITADCPFMDPRIIDLVLEQHLAANSDYTANVIEESFPDGEDVEVFSFDALERTAKEAVLRSEREHVTPYMRNHPDLFALTNVRNQNDLRSKRWTLDNPEDFEFVRSIYDRLYGQDPLFGMNRILALVTAHPELETVNRSIGRNEGYAKSIAEDTLVGDSKRTVEARKGQNLYSEAKKLIPGGTQLLSKRPEQFLPEHWPAYYSKAKGCEIWDLDGTRYIDMSYMGIGANTLGYCDEDVDRDVVAAVARGNMTTLNAPEEVELAKLLIELHPWAEMVRYARSGGEAMAVAIRIARAATQKDIILFCGYHGWSDWYISSNLSDDHALDGQLLPGLQPLGVPRGLMGTAFPFSYNNIAEFLSLIGTHRNKIAAVVVEAVRNVLPEKGFVEALRQETTRLQVPLVVDEVSSGWRLNLGGAHLVLGLDPDMAIFAKGMSNGYPMAAIIGKGRFMDAAQNSFISSTYWTDLIGPTAALATIRKMAKVDAQKHMVDAGKRVQTMWTDLAMKSGLSARVSGIHPLSHIEFEYTNPLVLKTLFTQLMLERGFLATTAFYASYAHKQEHLVAYSEAVDDVFRVMGQAQRDRNAESLLKGPICHSGFKRLT